MREMNQVIRRASMRLFISRALMGLVVLSTAAIAAVVALRLLEQGGVYGIDWAKVALYGPATVLLGSLAWGLLRPPSQLAVARRIDEGAGLKETLSTALCVRTERDAWSAAVVESAAKVAVGVDVKRAVPIQAPRRWTMPVIGALVAFVVWIAVPQFDALGKRALAQKKDDDQKKVDQAKTEAEKAKAKVEQLLAKVDPKLVEGKGDETGKPEEKKEIERKSPEEIRRAAIKSLTDMKEKIDAAQKSEKLQTASQMLEKLKQLRTPGSGPLTEMASALSQGKVSEAKGELEKMAKEIGEGKMDEGQKAKMAEQLSKMAKQLEQISKDKQSLEKALEQAGLDKNLANEPQKLADALKNNEQLSQEQKQAMQNMAEAAQNASQACQNMAQSMQKAAQAAQQAAQQGQQGQQGQDGQQGMSQEMAQAMQEMQNQMSQMEMAQQDMNSMQAAMSEAQKQLKAMSEGMSQSDSPGMGACDKGGLAGNGAFQDPGSEDGDGAGRGGQGISQGGGGMGEKAAAEKWEKIKAKTQDSGGPPIGTMLIQGEQVKGESKQAFTAVATAAEQEATEALENNVIERQYHDMVKRYFGQLSAKSKEGEKKPDAKDGKPAVEAPAKP